MVMTHLVMTNTTILRDVSIRARQSGRRRRGECATTHKTRDGGLAFTTLIAPSWHVENEARRCRRCRSQWGGGDLKCTSTPSRPATACGCRARGAPTRGRLQAVSVAPGGHGFAAHLTYVERAGSLTCALHKRHKLSTRRACVCAGIANHVLRKAMHSSKPSRSPGAAHLSRPLRSCQAKELPSVSARSRYHPGAEIMTSSMPSRQSGRTSLVPELRHRTVRR